MTLFNVFSLILLATTVFGVDRFRRFHLNETISTRIVLRCPLSWSDKDSITYYKVRSNGDLKEITNNGELKDYIIVNVVPEAMSSHYKCKVIRSKDSSTAIVDYYIDRKGEFQDIQKLKYSSATTIIKEKKLGESATLNCQNKPSGSSNYIWFGPDLLQINNSKAELEIKSLKSDDFGDYFCGRLEDVKDQVLMVEKIVIKDPSVIYEPNIKKASEILSYPMLNLGEPVSFQPRTAYARTRRLIWEYPPETVLLNQGRGFNREIFTHDMTQEEFYYRESDRLDVNHLNAWRVLFQSQEMANKSFSVEITPNPASVVIGSSIELICNNTLNYRATWHFKNSSTFMPQDLPAGITTRIEGPFTIARINSSEMIHSGTYICNAKKAAAQVSVTVTSQPKLIVSPSEIAVRPGTTARFLCQLINTVGTVIWRRKDKRSFRMDVESRIGGDTQATLVVQLAPKEFNGSIYECVHNELVVEVLLMVKDICPTNKRACTNGECIEESLFCNGVKDCSDISDEDPNVCAQCEPNQQACKEVKGMKPTQACVVKHWYCDGDNDCGNGFDELNCPKIDKDTCISTHFACNDNQTVIPRSLWCDKQTNCPNGDDELNCRAPEVVLPTKETTYVVHSSTSISLICEVVSVPTSTINWRYNWGSLPQKLNFTVKQTGTDCNRMRSTLTIHNMHANFAGVYTCEAVSSTRAMAKDYTLFVTSEKLCRRPYFNNAAWHKDLCLKCYCSNVTDDCESASGYFQSPFPRASTHSRAYLMNFMTKKILETGNSKSLYDSQSKAYRFYGDSYKNFVINSNMYLASDFGLSGSWLQSYSYYIIIRFKLTGSQWDDLHGPAVVIKNKNGKSLHWCRSDNSQVFYSSDTGYDNILELTLWEKENWYNNIACTALSTREDILNVLSDVSNILIRIKYYTNQTGFELNNITLEHTIAATKPGEAGVLVPRIEMCKCPFPYRGLSCENCVEGYKRNSESRCVKNCPINCEECLEGGECIKCKGHRSGPQCLQCKTGFVRGAKTSLLENCEECDCRYQSNDTLIVNECVRDLFTNGNIQCRCNGREINDRTCNSCLRKPILPEDIKICINKNKTENENCQKQGTQEIMNKKCQCKPGYKGDFCHECQSGYFQHGDKCLKCFCSNITAQCQSTTDYKFADVTLNSKDFKLNVKLTNRLLSGVYDADNIIGALKVNRTKDKIVIKRNPNGKGLIYVSINVEDMTDPDSIKTYTMMYGGKIMFKFKYVTDDPGSLYFIDANPFIEIESKKLGRLWAPLKYNDDTKFMEVTLAEDWFPSWKFSNEGSILNRESFIRALMTTQYISIGFPFDNDIVKKVEIIELSIEHARKLMDTGKLAPVEVCPCPFDNSGLKCEACNKAGFKSVMSLSPNLPDFSCGACNSPSCSQCSEGTYNYDFLLNKNFSSCQPGIEIKTKGRVIEVNKGETLAIPCNAKSYKGGVAIHEWTKREDSSPLKTFRQLDSDGSSNVILAFDDIQLTDGGHYTCNAKNAISNGSEEFFIIVIDKGPRLKVNIEVTTESKKNIQFNASIFSPENPTDYKIIWSIVKDGNKTAEETFKVKVRKEQNQYKIDVELTANITSGVQLRAIVVGTRVTNPFYYEIRQNIKHNISIQVEDLKISTDKNILNLKFLETGVVRVLTDPNIRTETFWFKISSNGSEVALPQGITKRGSELVVWSASENHNGKYVGYVINSADGSKIGKVNTEIKVSPMTPDVSSEMFNISKATNISIHLYVPLKLYCPNQTWELHNLKSVTVKDITKNVTRISDKEVIVNYPLVLGDTIRFRCSVIPDAHLTGDIKISLESKYPIIEIIPKIRESVYPDSMKCLDNNIAYQSNITWYFNGIIIGNKETIDWRNLGGFNPYMHEGVYTCWATNSLNNASKSVHMPTDTRTPSITGYIRLFSTTNQIKVENGTTRIYIVTGHKYHVGAELIGLPPFGSAVEWYRNDTRVTATKTGKFFSSLEVTATTADEHYGTYKVILRLSNGTILSKTFEILSQKELNYYVKIDGLDLNGDITILEGDSRVIGCKLIKRENNKEIEESNVKVTWKFKDSVGGTPMIANINGLQGKSDHTSIDILNAQSSLNQYKGQCLINFNGMNFTSKYFSFDVNQRNIDLRVKLMGLQENKYVENEEDATSQVTCQAYDENSKRLLQNAKYTWEMTYNVKNKKISWKQMIMNNNKITFGGLIYHKLNNSAVGRCKVDYFNNIVYSDEFTFRIKRKELNANLPKIKVDIIFDSKRPPYPVSVSCRDKNNNSTLNITLQISNPNFDKEIITLRPGWLLINFTLNGTEFNPHKHSGLYTFTISNEFGSRSKSILLPQKDNPNGNYSAKIVIYSPTGRIENDKIRVRSSSELKLICVYYGHPYPLSLKWTSAKIQHSNAVIQSLDYWTSITLAEFSSDRSAGEYECQAQSHQGILSRKVIVEGYSYGIRLEILDVSGKEMTKDNILKQGENFVIKYRAIDLFTNKEIKTLNGSWQFRFSSTDNFTDMTSTTFPKEELKFDGNTMNISKIVRTGKFEIRCKFQNKSEIFVSEIVKVNVNENIDLHPEPHFLFIHDKDSIYVTRLKCVDTSEAPSTVIITKITGFPNEEVKYVSNMKEAVARWEKRPFSPFYDIGTYQCLAFGKYTNKTIFVDLPEGVDKVLDTFVRFESRDHDIAIVDKKKTLNIIDGNRLNVLCNYYGSHQPITLVEIVFEGKSGESQASEQFATQSSTKLYYSQIIIDKFEMEKHSGIYTCRSRNATHTLTDTLHIRGLKPGLQIIVEGLDNENSVKVTMGSTKSFKCSAIDPITKKQILDVKYDWKSETLKGESFEIDDLSETNKRKDGNITFSLIKMKETILTRCEATTKNGTFYSNYFEISVIQDEMKKPKLQFTVIPGSVERGFPLSLRCVDERKNISDITIIRLSGDLPEATLTKKDNAANLIFPSNVSNPLLYVGSYQCDGTNRFGSDSKVVEVTFTRPINPLMVVIESKDSKIVTKLGLKFIEVPIDKRMELDCRYSGDNVPIAVRWVLNQDNQVFKLEKDKPIQGFTVFQKRSDCLSIVQQSFGQKKNIRLICSAKDSTGSEKSDSVEITSVIFGTNVGVIGLDNETEVSPNQGSEKTLTCKIIDLSTEKDISKNFAVTWIFTDESGKPIELNQLAESAVGKEEHLRLNSLKNLNKSLYGHCIANNGTHNVTSPKFKYVVKEDEFKKPELKILEVVEPNKKFPSKLKCTDGNTIESNMTVSRADNKPVPKEWISKEKGLIEVTFPAKESEFVANQGLYECQATNKFGSDRVSLEIKTLELLGVTINSTVNKIDVDQYGNLSTIVRRGRKLELNCFVTGQPTPKVTFSIKTQGYNPDLPIPGKKSNLVPNDINSEYEVKIITDKHYKMSRAYYSQSPPASFSCEAALGGKIESKTVAVREVDDIFKVNLISSQPSILYQVAYLDKPYDIACKLVDLVGKDVKIQSVKWILSSQNNTEVDFNKLAKVVIRKDNKLILEGITLIYGSTIRGKCAAYSNDTYDTLSEEFSVNIKESPKIKRIYLEVKANRSTSEFKFPLNYTYDATQTTQFTCRATGTTEVKPLTSWIKCLNESCSASEITGSGSSLVFFEDSTKYSDAGEYHCIAKLDINGKILSQRSEVIFIERKSAPQKFEDRKFTAKQSLSMRCDNDMSSPEGNYTWSFIPEGSNKEENISPKGSIKIEPRIHTLTMAKPITREYAGTYICKISNQYGVGGIRYTIIVP